MEYKAKKCPICGSIDIVEINKEYIYDNVFYKYGCNACLEVFSTKRSFLEKEKNKSLSNNNILSPNEIFKMNINNVISIRCKHNEIIKCGTGILIGNGYVLTNKHVVIGNSSNTNDIIDLCDTYICNGEAISSCELEFIYADKENDIALMYSDMLKGQISFSNEAVETGDSIYAIGNSKGHGLCIVNGLVSDKSRIINKKEYIMISAPTTNGNSGGPLLDSKGKLVGMITLGDEVVQTMNYAIPVSVLVSFIRRAIDTEELNIRI